MRREFWHLAGCALLVSVGMFLLLGLLPRQAMAGTTPPVNLSGSGSYARFPVISRAPDGMLCAAWSDNRDGPWNIYFSCSTTNGQSWSTPGRVYSSAQESLHAALLFSRTMPVFVWTEVVDFKAYTIHEKVGSVTGVVVPNVAQPVPRPSIARGNDGALHLVYADFQTPISQAGDVRYAHRPAGGNWLSPTVIFTSTYEVRDPRIAADSSGHLHVVWRENLPLAGDKIWYMTGTVGTGGVSWSPSVTASNLVSLAWQPDVAVTPGGDAHIVWTEKIGDNRYLAYTRFDAAGGRTPPQWLGGPFTVNQNNPYHLAPVVAASSDRVCIAWNACPPGESAEDIFLICSEDGGETWSPPENLSRTPAMSLRPSIAVAPDGSVHVVWQELAGTNYEYEYRVYYTHWLPHSVYLPLVMRNAR